jgi:hypothetical protein
VKDVVLVAGACARDGWADALPRLSGKLVSFHSGNDTTLASLPYAAAGGAQGLPPLSPAVVNVVAPGWEHDTYMKSLDTVLAKIRDLL